jgi:hypothetical protein
MRYKDYTTQVSRKEITPLLSRLQVDNRYCPLVHDDANGVKVGLEVINSQSRNNRYRREGSF